MLVCARVVDCVFDCLCVHLCLCLCVLMFVSSGDEAFIYVIPIFFLNADLPN